MPGPAASDAFAPMPAIDFVAVSEVMKRLLAVARRAAASDAPVLIIGESGSGKNRLARFLHEQGGRREGPWVEVACANLPVELAESELFGHRRGAFTDAHRDRLGRFEQADQGTLFLDDLKLLALEVQGKVLRAIEERRVVPLGAEQAVSARVRIVASCRQDPARLVREGRLREDLYYRLNVVRLALPPLRERGEDLERLVERFAAEAAVRHGRREALRPTPELIDRLRRYPWPGNVRQLQHVVEAAVVLSDDRCLDVDLLPPELSTADPSMLESAAARDLSLAQVEAAYIDEVLRRTGGNKSAAARILGIHRKTLHDKLRSRDEGPAG